MGIWNVFLHICWFSFLQSYQNLTVPFFRLYICGWLPIMTNLKFQITLSLQIRSTSLLKMSPCDLGTGYGFSMLLKLHWHGICNGEIFYEPTCACHSLYVSFIILSCLGWLLKMCAFNRWHVRRVAPVIFSPLSKCPFQNIFLVNQMMRWN